VETNERPQRSTVTTSSRRVFFYAGSDRYILEINNTSLIIERIWKRSLNKLSRRAKVEAMDLTGDGVVMVRAERSGEG